MQRPQATCQLTPLAAALAVGVGTFLLVVLTPIAGAAQIAEGTAFNAVIGLPGAVGAQRSDSLSIRFGDQTAEPLSLEPLGTAAWDVLVYFDAPLLTPDGLAASIAALESRAEEMLALGPVTLVVADPEPRELLVESSHPHEIRETLALFAERSTLAGELLWRRLRFAEARRDGEVDDQVARQAMEREQEIVERQLEALEECLRRRPGSQPKLLVLVQDGFDFDFKRFFLSRTDRLEELETDIGERHAALASEVAAAGWTVVGLSLGEQGSEFTHPLDPVRKLSQATGGELVLQEPKLDRALSELGNRWLVSFRAATSEDPQPLAISHVERPVVGPLWAGGRRQGPRSSRAASLDAASVVRLLSPGPGTHTGTQRVTAVTGGHDVGYVAFFQNDFLVGVAHRAPFQVRLDLGAETALHVVRASAFSGAGLELGSDVLRLNEHDQPFEVEIVGVHGDPEHGEVLLEAEATAPLGRRLTRLDFYWNDELRQSLEEVGSPAVVKVALATGSATSGDHYRVVAHLDDGSSLETARLASDDGFVDRVDVNLVELFALVSARGNGSMAELEREDFSLFHAGRSQPIQGFARAADVPLTLGMAVDTSDSMADWQNDLRDGAAIFFESALGERDQALLTDFNELPRLTQPPTRRRELLVGRMGALEFGGTTALYDAVLFSLTQFEGQGGRKALIVLTDGEDYGSRFRPERCIAEARRLGVPIYMIVLEGAGTQLEDVDRLINQRLARQTGGRIYYFSSRERLEEIYSAIESDLRSQYLLTWAVDRPLTVADLGDIRVEVRDRKLSVRTILGKSVSAR